MLEFFLIVFTLWVLSRPPDAQGNGPIKRFIKRRIEALASWGWSS